MDPALIFSIFRRLTGYPLDSSGNPRKVAGTNTPMNIEGKWGLRIPLFKDSTNAVRNLSTDTPGGINPLRSAWHKDQYRQVPIYFDGIDNMGWSKIFPACSFSVTDIRAGGDEPIFDLPDGQDGISVASAEVHDVTNSITGEVIAEDVPESYSIREHPDVYEVEIGFTLYAKNPFEMMFMERAFLHLFDPKLGLKVERLDGTIETVDFKFERYVAMDQGEPYDSQKGTAGSYPAFMKRGFIYTFETYLDNSLDGFDTYDFATYETILETYLKTCNILDESLDDSERRVIEQTKLEDQ